ncbi:MAG: tetratricopeptide repeat protein, partial [Gemmatimonadetes bacterium]|nr:tetratricopeptide repeat protein [Gemmatimonadota bacterium]
SGVALVRERLWRRLAVPAAVAVAAVALSSMTLLRPDTSNEWNKAGGLLRSAGRHAEAEEALLRAREENPANPNTYLNLAVLYRQTGRPDEAAEAEARARGILEVRPAEADAFRRALEAGGG